ncbi:MAG: hypothetical protein OQK29_01375 [Ignavibacteriaceae bacterium]|nr:hypothetical protein [Ignavibacteriaceae bacterium]
MSYKRYANKVDGNQTEIVKALRKIPGVSVSPDHDDILVGYQGRTYWFEIKDPKRTINKDGTVTAGAVKKTQLKLINEFNGHYNIVWTLDDILHELGIKSKEKRLCGRCWRLSTDNSPVCYCED